jgi:hypothetical protein
MSRLEWDGAEAVGDYQKTAKNEVRFIFSLKNEPDPVFVLTHSHFRLRKKIYRPVQNETVMPIKIK